MRPEAEKITFVAILPDGKSVDFPNKTQLDIAEGLMAVSKELPASMSELGVFVYGENFSDKSRGFELRSQIGAVSRQLESRGWIVGFNSNDQFWVEVDQRKPGTGLSSQEQSLEVVDLVEEKIWTRLTPIDRANLEETFIRDRQRFKREISRVQGYISAFAAGELEVPSDTQIIEETDQDERVKVVKKRLEGLIALSVVEPEHADVRNIYSWGARLNEMMLLLSATRPADEALFEVVSSLDDVSRAILLSQISMTKRYEIMKIGLMQVNEREMAYFINNSVFELHRASMPSNINDYRLGSAIDGVCEIIVTMSEREETDRGFSAAKVFEEFISHYPNGADFVFDRMIRAAKDLNLEAELMALFCASPQTYHLAARISDDYFKGPGGEDEDEQYFVRD